VARAAEPGRPGLEVLPAPGLGPGVRAWFTTRRGGVSLPPRDGLNLGAGVGDDPAAVAANRSAVADLVHAPVTWIRAVHGSTVGIVDGAGEVRPVPPAVDGRADGACDIDLLDGDPRLDALVTTTGGRALAALAADCVPVLLAGHDDAGVPRAVGAVHSGRRGVALGVVPRAVAALRALGAARVSAVVGPAVCGRCYEVPEVMRAEVSAVVPETWATTRRGTPSLDLPAGVTAQLRAADVRTLDLGLCTQETPWLFSHRRLQPGGRACGVVLLDG